MKNVIFYLFLLFIAGACCHQPEWQMVWEEEFEGDTLDSTVWSRIPRGTADWQNTQSFDDRCFEMRNGSLILKGIVNDDLTQDSAAYLTGGVWTKGKHAFTGGRIEVKARLQGAQGAWPAIWMLPFESEKYPWPYGGEIDIMERLNFDTIAYQTVHSHYTYNLGIKDNPRPGSVMAISPDEFNVYGVDLWPDSLVFHINHQRHFAYPRIETQEEGQFPFDISQFLLIDMQLGGSWVGAVNPEDLPVEMEIDWVRHYQMR
ncbi:MULTISPECIES: glycoside hydrolase family 16 protein [unclassified Carboxylicivirga]|uniref:glycoside hydrolase family 16 protein n=1 Tax=Carboxylicivirga TaxID=1628153 RepID=UPI003D3425E7